MKKELLEEKIKKYKEKLGALQEELEKKKDSIESGDVFKVTHHKAQKSWSVYMAKKATAPDGTPINRVLTLVTSVNKDLVCFAMKVLRKLEKEDTFDFMIDCMVERDLTKEYFKKGGQGEI